MAHKPEKPKLTEKVVSEIESSLEERKTGVDRRQLEMTLPSAIERRQGKDRRSESELVSVKSY